MFITSFQLQHVTKSEHVQIMVDNWKFIHEPMTIIVLTL